MDFLKQIPTFIYLLLILTSVIAENITKELKLAQIEALEKEQSDLYRQINDAIEDSVKNLKETNDSDAQVGITYITELKKQIDELNGTTDDVNSDPNARRSVYTRFEGKSRKKKNEDKLFIDKLFKDKNLNDKKMALFQNREAMQKRIEEWIQKRLEEKKKIHKYKNSEKMKFVKEKCLRYGSNKKKSSRGSKKKFSGTRPCCRKCCKMSYMGCL